MEINNKSSIFTRNNDYTIDDRQAQNNIVVLNHGVQNSKSDEDEEDTVEEDIGDFSICQERMVVQSQIKSLLENEQKQLMNFNKKESVVMRESVTIVNEGESAEKHEDESDDLDTNENPFDEGNNAIHLNTRNMMQVKQKTNQVPTSIVNNSMIDTKNRQLGYQSPVKKLFQLKFSGSPVLNSEVTLQSKNKIMPAGGANLANSRPHMSFMQQTPSMRNLNMLYFSSNEVNKKFYLKDSSKRHSLKHNRSLNSKLNQKLL